MRMVLRKHWTILACLGWLSSASGDFSPSRQWLQSSGNPNTFRSLGARQFLSEPPQQFRRHRLSNCLRVLSLRGGANAEPKVKPLLLPVDRLPYLHLEPRTEPRVNHAGRTAPSRMSDVTPAHIKALEFLLLDGPRAMQTLLGAALLVEALLFMLADAPSSGSRYFQLCAALACVRNVVEFARRAGAIGLNVQGDGLLRTQAKLTALARSAAAKYAFFGLFLLLFRHLFTTTVAAAGGATGGTATAAPGAALLDYLQLPRLSLLPLLSRELVHLGWCVRDGLQWMEATEATTAEDDDRELLDGEKSAPGHWAASAMRHAGGASAAVLCGRTPSQFKALSDEKQAALLSKRTLQLNTALEAALFCALAMRRGAFPTSAHKALCLFVLLRILLADAWAQPVAYLRELAPFVATTSSKSRGEEGSDKTRASKSDSDFLRDLDLGTPDAPSNEVEEADERSNESSGSEGSETSASDSSEASDSESDSD